MTEQGHLDSLHNSKLESQVDGSTTIIFIVPEGTLVKEGDLVCELDSSVLAQDEVQQRIDMVTAEAAMQLAKENVDIQKAQNKSDVATALLAWKLAELDLKKFVEGEYQQQQKQIEGEITLAQVDLVSAQATYNFTRRLSKKGYRSQTDLEASRIAVLQKEIALNVAKEKLRVLNDYTSKRTIAEFEFNAAEYKRQWERAQVKAASALAQMNADYEACKLKYEVQKARYEKVVKQIAACKMHAPQDGTIVYANDDGGRRSDDQVIAEGTIVRERQDIIKIPDLTQMKVDARIHESRIGLIQEGLPVLVRVDAVPDKVFHGVVESVASVPSSTNWLNRDLKEYDAVVRITDDVSKSGQLRPGLTAEVEIIVEQRADVLQIPIQSAVAVGPKRYVWIIEPEGIERRELVIGATNDRFVEVLDGVAKGERVVMNPRTTFGEQIAELESQMSQKRARRRVAGGAAAPNSKEKGPAKHRGRGRPTSRAKQS